MTFKQRLDQTEYTVQDVCTVTELSESDATKLCTGELRCEDITALQLYKLSHMLNCSMEDLIQVRPYFTLMPFEDAGFYDVVEYRTEPYAEGEAFTSFEIIPNMIELTQGMLKKIDFNKTLYNTLMGKSFTFPVLIERFANGMEFITDYEENFEDLNKRKTAIDDIVMMDMETLRKKLFQQAKRLGIEVQDLHPKN